MAKSATIVGAGFGGLATACLLAHDGWDVTVLEKNDQIGGRAGVFEAKGFRFDTGPSWYLMPDVFERFFKGLGENITDYLQLERLQPSYRVFFKDEGKQVDIFGDLARDRLAFEQFEPGAGKALERYLERIAYVHKVATEEFLYKNYNSVKDFMTPRLLRETTKLNVLSNMHNYVAKYFKSPQLQQIIEYPLVFLGTSPYSAPALYSFMNHVDLHQGVFYPKGGMYEVVKALQKIAKQKGVKFQLNTPVSKILVEDSQATGVVAAGKRLKADVVISNADPHHTETKLLEPSQRDHTDKYWQKRTLAPSALLMYLGVDKQFRNLQHHNLLFSQNWRQNFRELVDFPGFPTDPSIYVCAPGKTDPTLAPKGKENLFVLVPVSAGLNYTDGQLESYADRVLETLETTMRLPGLRKNIIYQKLFCVKDFEEQYNSFRGTGLGLAHTLKQTAAFRPSNTSKKVRGLYYVGANTHPGIGLPACLVSAELVRRRLN